jgi:hypothetical protein
MVAVAPPPDLDDPNPAPDAAPLGPDESWDWNDAGWWDDEAWEEDPKPGRRPRPRGGTKRDLYGGAYAAKKQEGRRGTFVRVK